MGEATERNDEEREAWLRLIRVPGLGAHALRELLDRFGSASAVVDRIQRDAAAPAVPAAARDWLLRPDERALAGDRDWLAPPDHHLLTWLDVDYPALLRETPRPPMALFVRGNPGLLWQPQIAIVGSRNPSAAGRDNAEAFAATLGNSGFTVVSGLASGVDAAAHEGALKASASTIAVVGAGPDVVYPPANAGLAERIAATGVLVSEFPPGTPPRPAHFPQRNRIIAGLSLGVLVVEAALRSGSLITARLATEAGRDVFALPGSIHNPLARGCHRLIRDGAKLVETAGEVIDELRPLALQLGERLRATLAGSSTSPFESGASGLDDGQMHGRLSDPDYRRLWDALGYETTSIDVIAARTGLTAPAISSMLLLMELDGLITVGANGRYGRAVRKAE